MLRKKLELTNISDNYQDTYQMPRIPNGWYAVALSNELKKDQLLSLSYFSKELIAFRDDEGQAVVMDAYCPHFGAHLGKGGTVEKGQVRCPFHGWRFDGSGQCTEAPFARGVPRGERSRIDTYPVAEENGVIMVWYHVAGLAPSYGVPRFAEMERRQWTATKHFRLILRTHVQEVRENFCDESHFAFIHKQKAPAQLEWREDGPRAHHVAIISWWLFDKLGLSEKFPFRLQSTFYGPGVLLSQTTGLFDVTAFALCTPIDDQHTEFLFLGTGRKPRFFPFIGVFSRWLMLSTAKQDVLEEGEIWSHKEYLEKPIFQAHERTTSVFRRWYQQFYDGYPGYEKTDQLEVEQPDIAASLQVIKA